MHKDNIISKKKILSKDGDYLIIPIETKYISPNESLNPILDKAKYLIKDGDFFVIAETPIAISQGRLINESKYKPSFKSWFLAIVWSKYFWGYILGPLIKIKKRTIKNLRKLPKESIIHKEVVLKLYGWKHALKPASEAGIDLSNAPGNYVSLLPNDPQKVAIEIKNYLNKNIKVLIVDTDATYKRKNKYFTGLPIAIDGIDSDKGFLAYFLGQFCENIGSTPLASSCKINVEDALKIANISEDYQKTLASTMSTIHDAKKILGLEGSKITLDHLNSIIHTPAVIIRKVDNDFDS
ncbi:MAG: coenzyme F420-0:L-glutamate ligase [Methanobacteriaceae archaeon]|jgi:F420-0:gamma-glutamyl ligase-like protein|nr:coenzyme F420-0:L-glutamate ligase [Methanobacteriaceae archaeon]